MNLTISHAVEYDRVAIVGNVKISYNSTTHKFYIELPKTVISSSGVDYDLSRISSIYHVTNKPYRNLKQIFALWGSLGNDFKKELLSSTVWNGKSLTSEDVIALSEDYAMAYARIAS